MREFLLTVATIGAMVMIVPLIVWGGSGSWRHALHALRSYLKIMAGFVVVGGGLALIMVFGERF